MCGCVAIGVGDVSLLTVPASQNVPRRSPTAVVDNAGTRIRRFGPPSNRLLLGQHDFFGRILNPALFEWKPSSVVNRGHAQVPTAVQTVTGQAITGIIGPITIGVGLAFFVIDVERATEQVAVDAAERIDNGALGDRVLSCSAADDSPINPIFDVETVCVP